MKIKGVKRGNCIEILEYTYLADGTQFCVENFNFLPDPIAQWKQL